MKTPPFAGGSDLVDSTDPQWRRAHPSKEGVLGINGGAFTSIYPDNRTAATDQRLNQAMTAIINDYNTSGNPGRFVLRTENPFRVSVVGVSMSDSQGKQEKVVPVLDTIVDSPADKTSALIVISTLLHELTLKTSITFELGTANANILSQTSVPYSGEATLTARELLQVVSKAARCSLVWTLLWDQNRQLYVLNLTPGARTWLAADGTRLGECVKSD